MEFLSSWTEWGGICLACPFQKVPLCLVVLHTCDLETSSLPMVISPWLSKPWEDITKTWFPFPFRRVKHCTLCTKNYPGHFALMRVTVQNVHTRVEWHWTLGLQAWQDCATGQHRARAEFWIQSNTGLCPDVLFRIPHYIGHPVSSVSQLFHVLDDLDSCEQYGQIFCRLSLHWYMSDVFLWSDWGYLGRLQR